MSFSGNFIIFPLTFMNTKKLTTMALLLSISLIIFVIEAQLPSLTPIPGVKLGLANIITVYAIFVLSPLDTLIILLCRIFLGSIFSGNMSVILYSLSGGLLCYISMLLAKRFLTLDSIWICSIIGAISHNIGQILMAIFITKTLSLTFYLPVLLLSGIITGMFTGITSQYLINKLKFIKNSL